MKILLIGDPHLRIANIQACEQFLNWVTEVVEEYKPGMVVNLGDTFNDHSVIRSEIMGLFKKHLDDVGSLCHDYRYVLGNHDMFKPNDSTYHALLPFKDQRSFTVYDAPVHVGDFSFIPYIPDPKNFPLETRRIAFVHQTFTGANYGGGYLAPDTEVDFRQVSAELIISGHIHVSQWLSDKVFYPGTPFAQSVDDVDQSKGVYLFDSDSLELKFIQSPLPQWKRLSVPSVSLTEQLKFVEEHTNEQDVWNLDIEGERSELNSLIFHSSMDKLRKSRTIKFRPKYLNSTKIRRAQIKSSSIKEILEEYVDKIYSGALDKEKLKNILSEVSTTVNTK